MFIDFDGTLAPIVDDPAEARPHSRAIDALRRLSERWGVVAVVSGRPAAYLVEHLSGAGRTQFLGLYGLEQASGDESPVRTHPDAETWRRAVSAAADEAERSGGPVPAVERKGLTVTLHYRAAPDQAAAVVGLADRLARRYGLDAHGGKMSVELRPPVEVDKGTVIADRAAGLAAVAFAGDDLGDLPAFRALAALRSTGVATLAVASGGPETPPEVLESADVVVEGPDGVVGLLEELVAQT